MTVAATSFVEGILARQSAVADAAAAQRAADLRTYADLLHVLATAEKPAPRVNADVVKLAGRLGFTVDDVAAHTAAVVDDYAASVVLDARRTTAATGRPESAVIAAYRAESNRRAAEIHATDGLDAAVRYQEARRAGWVPERLALVAANGDAQSAAADVRRLLAERATDRQRFAFLFADGAPA